MEEHPYNTPEVVLQMIVDDVRQIKETQAEQAGENKEDHLRLNDKLDGLTKEMNTGLRDHDRDIVRLTTQAALAGRTAGFVAGGVAGVVTGVLIQVITGMMLRGGV